MMVRLFVAIRPPDTIRTQLLASMEGVDGARWKDEDQLHLTLRFIGEVELQVAEDIVLAIRQIRADPFEIALSGVGTFERKGRVNSLWAGVSPDAALAALSRKIDRALVTTGLPPEGRAFKPHITLARFGKASGNIGPFLAMHGDLSSPAFPIRSFHLYESRLEASGSSYSVVETFKLNG
jgi:RNA 2',3'-cyclic 3'-phosphodiesterase